MYIFNKVDVTFLYLILLQALTNFHQNGYSKYEALLYRISNNVVKCFETMTSLSGLKSQVFSSICCIHQTLIELTCIVKFMAVLNLVSLTYSFLSIMKHQNCS